MDNPGLVYDEEITSRAFPRKETVGDIYILLIRTNCNWDFGGIRVIFPMDEEKIILVPRILNCQTFKPTEPQT